MMNDFMENFNHFELFSNTVLTLIGNFICVTKHI